MKLSAMRVCVGAVVCLGIAAAMLLGERPPAVPEYRVPLVQDWTHRSLIYSAPRSILQNLQLQQQTRYAQQYLRRNVFFRGPIGPPVFDPIRILRRGTTGLQRDWGIPAGNGFSVGQGNYPAKYVFDVNAAPSCSKDYVVFTTNQGAGLDIYAVNNLYVNGGPTGFCAPATAPTILWAYHIQSQTNGTSNTSPVLSFAGDQISWVEGSATGGHTAALHMLKPNTSGAGQGTIAAPTTPTASGTAAAYVTCRATAGPCLLNLPFANGDDDSGDGLNISPSSPYYDYPYDKLYVGDDGGNLHEFTGVFLGTPAEVTSGGWPVAMLPADATPDLGSPVYDDTSQNAFVGDFQGRVFYVRTAAGSAGTCNAGSNGGNPPCVGSTTYTDGDTTNTKITAPPIVDSTTHRVFIFFSPNGGGPGAMVGQDDTTLSAGAQVTVNVGTGTAWRLNQGTLDNLYYTSDTGLGTGTGYIYFCGNDGATGADANFAFLQRIAVTNGTMANAVDGTVGASWVASNASSRSSPVSEFFNTTTGVDYLFFGVEAGGAATACAGNGCVYALTITGGALKVPPTAGTGAVTASGGTSGIIVDNDSASTAAASIYFTWRVNGTAGLTYTCNGVTGNGTVCALKLTQSGLN
jgi:hypothetical protein